MNYLAQVDIGKEFLGTSSKLASLEGIGSLVTLFVNTAFVLASLILLFYFLLGGIGMMSAAGKSDPQKAEQAKKTVTSAVIGFVIVFTAFWIVQILATLFGIKDTVFTQLFGI